MPKKDQNGKDRRFFNSKKPRIPTRTFLNSITDMFCGNERYTVAGAITFAPVIIQLAGVVLIITDVEIVVGARLVPFLNHRLPIIFYTKQLSALSLLLLLAIIVG